MSTIESQLGYRLQPVWPCPSSKDQADVVQFWLREQAMPEPEACLRAPQLLVVARDEVGRVAGVSTALAMRIERLAIDAFYYRTFVGQAHRARGLSSSSLAHDILVASFNHLNRRFLRGIDPNIIGLFLDIENRAAARLYNQVIWREGEISCVYVGQTPAGHHLRIAYFDEARVGLRPLTAVASTGAACATFW
jgi:hypothetical protein